MKKLTQKRYPEGPVESAFVMFTGCKSIIIGGGKKISGGKMAITGDKVGSTGESL
ncbi:hypothetical protein [Fictibacillus phosphorivorans]|uniref:hypothetical protein n=1 Tax=Fictibacillus phosphorivorans TaxID=1221500 RepID=UPI0016426729|nr:hypothetical protein [Fictibacillus phosphorivorans]